MKVEKGERKGKRSMKTTILWRSALVVSALLVVPFAILGEAAPMGEAGPPVATPPLKVATPPLKVTTPALKVTFRPFSDFLDAQGTQSKFFPPVPDYVGWTNNIDINKFTLFALVDYAGLANDYLGGTLGTRVHGFVIQRELADGRAQILVGIFTTNALGFAQSGAALRSNGFDFLDTPTVFGHKAQDVASGKKAAVGQSAFLVTFTIAAPGARLPDLVHVVTSPPPPEFAPVDLTFIATVPGKCEHGTRAVLHVDQAGPPDVPVREIVKIVNEPCH